MLHYGREGMVTGASWLLLECGADSNLYISVGKEERTDWKQPVYKPGDLLLCSTCSTETLSPTGVTSSPIASPAEDPHTKCMILQGTLYIQTMFKYNKGHLFCFW